MTGETSQTSTRRFAVDLISGVLADILEQNPGEIREGHSLVEDLGADSLALIELAEGVEGALKALGIDLRFEDESLAEIRTIGDAADYVHKGLPDGWTPPK